MADASLFLEKHSYGFWNRRRLQPTASVSHSSAGGDDRPNPNHLVLAVEILVPRDEVVDAGLDWRRGAEADIGDEGIHVGIGGRHVAGLRGEEVLTCRASERLLDAADEVHQRDW